MGHDLTHELFSRKLSFLQEVQLLSIFSQVLQDPEQRSQIRKLPEGKNPSRHLSTQVIVVRLPTRGAGHPLLQDLVKLSKKKSVIQEEQRTLVPELSQVLQGFGQGLQREVFRSL